MSVYDMEFSLEYIRRLASGNESEDVEFKETTGQLNRGMETLCGRENRKNTSMPPNPVIANVMYLGGLIEHWGRGLSMMTRECERVGLPAPEFTQDGVIVKTIFTRPDSTSKDTVGVQLEYSRNKGNLTTLIMKGILRYMVLAIGLMVMAAGCVKDKDEPEWFLQTGDALPQFEVVTLDGQTICSADSYKAEMVIVFFNTTCPDCRREFPELQKRYEANLELPEADRDIYICIAREEGAEDIERYWQENNLTLPVSPQPDRRIYSLFASIGIPRTFYARNGRILRTE